MLYQHRRVISNEFCLINGENRIFFFGNEQANRIHETSNMIADVIMDSPELSMSNIHITHKIFNSILRPAHNSSSTQSNRMNVLRAFEFRILFDWVKDVHGKYIATSNVDDLLRRTKVFMVIPPRLLGILRANTRAH